MCAYIENQQHGKALTLQFRIGQSVSATEYIPNRTPIHYERACHRNLVPVIYFFIPLDLGFEK